jgi:formylglycine-generating enzyme required for sulfatase activity
MHNNKYVLIVLFCAALAVFAACNSDPEIGLPVEMVWIPGGSFQMGNPDTSTYYYTDNERPVHTVIISGFYVGKYEVTQVQYKDIMGDNPATGTAGYDNGGFKDGGGYPVYFVSWYDAVEFCNRLSEREELTPVYTITDKTFAIGGSTITGATVTVNWNNNGYRLPTEAEWEYAARGGNGSPGNYIYAGSNTVGDVAWYEGNNSKSKARGTQRVGTKAPNGLGLYDMSGNVSEWCWDWYGDYPSEAQTDPTGPSSESQRMTPSVTRSTGSGEESPSPWSRRTIRGGYGKSLTTRELRSTYRTGTEPSDTSIIGFRLARSQ